MHMYRYVATAYSAELLVCSMTMCPIYRSLSPSQLLVHSTLTAVTYRATRSPTLFISLSRPFLPSPFPSSPFLFPANKSDPLLTFPLPLPSPEQALTIDGYVLAPTSNSSRRSIPLLL